jgi:hypothetical protein
VQKYTLFEHEMPEKTRVVQIYTTFAEIWGNRYKCSANLHHIRRDLRKPVQMYCKNAPRVPFETSLTVIRTKSAASFGRLPRAASSCEIAIRLPLQSESPAVAREFFFPNGPWASKRRFLGVTVQAMIHQVNKRYKMQRTSTIRL